MKYNIEFQLAGLIVILILQAAFFSKKRWPSIPNYIFKVLLIVTFIEVLFDIFSVILITESNIVPSGLIDFITKAYLFLMLVYIYLVDVYAIFNTKKDDESRKISLIKQFEFIFFSAGVCASCIVVAKYKLLYGGEGKFVFSYGVPHNMVCIYAAMSVIGLICIFVVNIHKAKIEKLISILSFCVVQGFTAILHIVSDQISFTGFGTVAIVLVMYFILENPDLKLMTELNTANKKIKDLFLNILPEPYVDKLKNDYAPFYDEFDDVSILFLDIVDFAKMSSEIGETKIIVLLNTFFSELDMLVEHFKVEKIKTISDAYMVAAGLPEKNADHCEELMKFAKAVFPLLQEFNKAHNVDFHVRIGINAGKVVAGIIGKKKFIYDLWGDSVNLASKMENYGMTDKINVSESVYSRLQQAEKFEKTGPVNVNGFGNVYTYVYNGE